MTGFWIPVIAGMTVLLSACAGRQPAGPDDGPLTVVVNGGASSSANDRADIAEARIEGDLLHLDVSAGGGCAEHEFSLYQSGTFRESYPVQTDLRLTHDDNDDPCDAIVHRALVFDLTPLKQLYRSSYAAQSGIIDIHLAAPGGGQANPSTVRYTF